MYEIYKKLCEERGISTYKVAKDTGLTQSALSQWKDGKIKELKLSKLQILADYFDVPIDTFLKKLE